MHKLSGLSEGYKETLFASETGKLVVIDNADILLDDAKWERYFVR